MWLYLFALVFAVLAVAGGIATGGIFVIVFVPLALLALLAAILMSASSRRTGQDTRHDWAAEHHEAAETFPSGQGPPPPQRPATPGELTDARRRAQ